MNLSELDNKVTLKCFKVKRGTRTYVFDLYKYFDDPMKCYEMCTKLKKNLGTSMLVETKNSEEDEKAKQKSRSKDDEEDNGSGNDETKVEDKKVRKKKRKEKGKLSKKVTIPDEPIYSFGGDQIAKIRKYLIDNKIVPEKEIKL